MPAASERLVGILTQDSMAAERFSERSTYRVANIRGVSESLPGILQGSQVAALIFVIRLKLT